MKKYMFLLAIVFLPFFSANAAASEESAKLMPKVLIKGVALVNAVGCGFLGYKTHTLLKDAIRVLHGDLQHVTIPSLRNYLQYMINVQHMTDKGLNASTANAFLNKTACGMFCVSGLGVASTIVSGFVAAAFLFGWVK